MNRPSSLPILFLVLLAVFLPACGSSDSPTGPGGGGGGSSATELAQVLAAAPDFQDVVPSLQETEAEEFDGGDPQYFCTRKTVDLVEGYSDYPQFDPNSQVIFPGNLLQGNTLDDATPSGIPIDRGPGRIVMTLVNGASDVTRDLDAVGLGSVFNAMNEIIAASPDDLPARTTFTMEQVSSREQLGVSVRARYENLTTEVKGALNYRSDVKYNRFLVKLTQSYYTIAFEPPTDPGDFFGPAATVEQLSQYVGPTNPAAYVSSVTYGRIFYLLIQSTESVQSMRASIKASFDGAVTSGSISGDVKYVSELESIETGGYAIGGDSQLANAALLGNFDDLIAFVRDGDRITTGQPISYTVNSAKRPAKRLKVKVATSYDVVDCTPIGESLDAGVAWYRSDHGVSTRSYFGGAAVTRWADLLGDSSHDATVPFGGPDVAAMYNPGSVPTVSFQFSSGNMTGRLKIPGSNMRNTDYTIFAVVKRSGLPPSDNTPVYWLWGDGDTANQVLRIGFPDVNTVSVSHGGSQILTAPTVRPVYDQYLVFTLLFSQEDGLTIYINGLQRAHDPTIVTPLELFTGASIGVADVQGRSSGVGFGAIEMLDLQVYGIAATDAQRSYVESSLLERYGI